MKLFWGSVKNNINKFDESADKHICENDNMEVGLWLKRMELL